MLHRHEGLLRPILVSVAAVLAASVIALAGCEDPLSQVRDTDLSTESLSGFRLGQTVDLPTLEAAFGPLFMEARPSGIRTLSFESPTQSVTVNLDDDSHITGINVGFADSPGPTTSRGIGSTSMASDVLATYGESYRRETFSNFMGSGDGFRLLYTNKAHGAAITFEFNEGDPNLDKSVRRTRLTGIRLYKP